MSKVGAYLHSKPDGTPFYVGKGTVKRSRELLSGRNKWHQNIVSKHGRENIVITFMECSTENFAFELEKGLIKTFRNNGYQLCNIKAGGEGESGWKVDRAIVERVASKNRGRVQSPEERARRSVALKGKKKLVPRSDEHKRKLGMNSKGKRWYNNGQNIVFCLEEMQPEGYILGRQSRTFCKEK